MSRFFLVFVLLVLAISVGQAASWNVTTDYTGSNPIGQWAYGLVSLNAGAPNTSDFQTAILNGGGWHWDYNRTMADGNNYGDDFSLLMVILK